MATGKTLVRKMLLVSLSAKLFVVKTNISRPNAGQKYCRMLQREHSAILLTFITLPFVIKIFVLFIFESRLYIGFTVTFEPLKQELGAQW